MPANGPGFSLFESATSSFELRPLGEHMCSLCIYIYICVQVSAYFASLCKFQALRGVTDVTGLGGTRWVFKVCKNEKKRFFTSEAACNFSGVQPVGSAEERAEVFPVMLENI